MNQNELSASKPTSPAPKPGDIDLTCATANILPGTCVKITQGLWRAMGGAEPVNLEDERIIDLAFYVLFALAGLTAGERTHQERSDVLLVPVAFGEDFWIRIEAGKGDPDKLEIRISLPEEAISNEVK